MDWSTALPAVVGTLVGGGITLTAQWITDRRREAATVGAENRAEDRLDKDRRRKLVRELHDRVSEDVASLRHALNEASALVNIERAEALEPMVRDAGARWDRATASIAVVEDESVRVAADKVYEAWVYYLGAEADALVNETPRPPVREMTAAGRQFSIAVRSYLEALGRVNLRT